MDLSNLDPLTLGIAAAVMLVVLLGIAGFVVHRASRTRRFERRYGPDYARTVDHAGSRRRAEQLLEARDERRETFELHPVAVADRDRLRTAWQEVQLAFVDAPVEAARRAGELVEEAATARGYPDGERDQRLSDMSYDHSAEVDRYRRATAGEERERSTEAHRETLLAARALLEAMLARHLPGEADVPPGGSDVPPGETAVPPGGSDAPPGEADVPVGGSDVPLGGSDVPLGGSDVPLGGSDVPPGAAETVSEVGPADELSGGRRDTPPLLRADTQA
jgi:hypothetical protein